ncbi:hypothetical protein PISMIDRAFT_93123 [Pisolithus microcarpus 441]|uniref:Unplaced genomic scaffold scaffold_12, whole genome shotgun sequence n=1 Tax=Pisolithus microcarpus 441 TaxID=765257 RepID=A0A0C9ZE28_9AGAM|nr:hypothetical protein PISMIDRAFT_93123 [Pisolithus microcarpus 441]
MATVTHIIRSEYDPADRERLERETGQLDVENLTDPWQTESSFSAQRRLRAAPSFVPATIPYDEWGERSSPPPRSCTVPPPEDAQTQKRTLREGINKNNWFISRALRSEPDVTPSPPPSLAEILTRDPPPLPSQERFKPPVWLHIGPTNKGYAMLQRSGWNEGEGLGAHAIRRTRVVEPSKEDTKDSASTDVIDLTQSDSESEIEPDEDFGTSEATSMHERTSSHPLDETSAPYSQKSLLTPIPTVLKADRLGIGLKAKTEGPYKRSKKRVTHNAAALAAHVRASKEIQRKKAEVGRGSKGFAKLHKWEEERRKWMLAYLNE